MKFVMMRYFLPVWFLALVAWAADNASLEPSGPRTSGPVYEALIDFRANVTASVGRNLAPEQSNASVSLEPQFTLVPRIGPDWQIYALIDRPFDRYEPVSVPKISISVREPLTQNARFNSTASFAASFVELENWARDGGMWRPSLQMEGVFKPFSQFSVGSRAGYYRQLSNYATRVDGRMLAQQGFNERVFLSARWRSFFLETHLLFEQRKAASWEGYFEIYLRGSYRLNSAWTFGVTHQLLTGLVDDATGLFRPVRVYDGRDSRVSAFVSAEL